MSWSNLLGFTSHFPNPSGSWSIEGKSAFTTAEWEVVGEVVGHFADKMLPRLAALAPSFTNHLPINLAWDFALLIPRNSYSYNQPSVQRLPH